MDINSEGIYNSKTLAPFKENNVCMTQQENGNSYFFYMAQENETTMPSEITIQAHQPENGSTVTLLGYNQPLKWKKIGNGFTVIIPKKLQKTPPCNFVWTIKVSQLAK
ncbi:MAG: alpha-L-fucosidase C-terminal domain-containing protein [Bacteroidota bacterium]